MPSTLRTEMSRFASQLYVFILVYCQERMILKIISTCILWFCSEFLNLSSSLRIYCIRQRGQMPCSNLRILALLRKPLLTTLWLLLATHLTMLVRIRPCELVSFVFLSLIDLQKRGLNLLRLSAAPEVLGPEKYDKSCDMWSLGVIMYILWVKTNPSSPKVTCARLI